MFDDTNPGLKHIYIYTVYIYIYMFKLYMSASFVDKCSVIHVGHENLKCGYKLGDHVLKSSESERDLGVLVNENGKFSTQCNQVVKSANAVLGIIRRHITCKKKDIIVRLYKSLLRPKLEYCVQVWRPYLQKDIQNMERVQHRATKMIRECRMLNYEDRLCITGLTTLEKRRDRGDLIEVFKLIKGFDKVDCRQFFQLASCSRTRGHRYKIVKFRSRSAIRKAFFSQKVVHI